MSVRQGSSSFVLVIGAITALVVGGMVLTFVVFPIYNTMTAAPFWSADTVAGSRVVTFVGGLWEFWGGVILLAILSFVWVRTRQ